MRSLLVLTCLLLGACVPCAGAAERSSPKPVGELPEIKELPNPFLFANGSPVRTKADWERRRRELKELFQDYEYGHKPVRSEKMTVKKADPIIDEENKVTLQDLELKLEQGGNTLTLHILVALPKDSKGPVPVLVQSGFGRRRGNRPGGEAAAPSGRRFTTFTKRGYAVAECSFSEAAIDNKDRARSAGVYQLYGDKIDCGALMAWAWCVSRVVDALEKMDQIDAKKVIVTGHSRYGKAALLAGAFDERIALTVPSHSGCAGSAPFRFIYGKSEQLKNIAGAFPYWFRPHFNEFADKVERLPVDQHLLLALVAPRGLLQTEGTKDSWTNPEGAQLTHLAAKKVYDFLKAGDRISIRFRPVGHIPSNEDLLDFADYVFFGKKLPDDFGKLSYTEEKSAFRWNAPR